MPAGAVWVNNEVKIRPGVYVRPIDAGPQAVPAVRQGTVATVIRSDWGPLNTPTVLTTEQAVNELFGTGGTTYNVLEALDAGAARALVTRLGSAATKASRTLVDTQGVPANVVRIDAKHPGTRPNAAVGAWTLTIRDALTNTTQRELLLYEGTTLLQTVRFNIAGNQADNLVAAVAALNGGEGSPWIDATRLGVAGDGAVLATVTNVAVNTVAGTDPVVDGAAYTAALAAMETQQFNVLTTDTEDTAIQSTIATWVRRVVSEGLRIIWVTGESTSIAFATRKTNASGFNHEAIVYVGNGVVTSDGTIKEGHRVAALVAGTIASKDYSASLTAVAVNASEVQGLLTNAQIEDAILAGMMVFSMSPSQLPQIEYGINTLVSVGGSTNKDAGWQKIRRTRIRYNLIDRIVLAVSQMIGNVANDTIGRTAVVSTMQTVLNDMIRERALGTGATAGVDDTYQSAGDTAYFFIDADDLDAIERIYDTFRFRFAPAA